jgi:putative spermidine/putrescine transport system substrate-binding protein
MVLLFDLNGTLTDPAAIGGPWGIPELGPAVLAAAVQTAAVDALTGRYRAFAEHVGAAVSVEAERRGLDSRLVGDAVAKAAELPAHPDVEPGLAELARDGHRLAVLTNSGADAGRSTLEAAGLAQHFEAVLGVDAVRSFKPHPSTYAHACEALGAAPARIMLVAVHQWDTTGAKRAACGRPGSTATVSRSALPPTSRTSARPTSATWPGFCDEHRVNRPEVSAGPTVMPPSRYALLALAGVLLALALGACGRDEPTGTRAATGSAAEPWSAVRREARGQTVRWWMYGGDDRVNAYVDDHVIPAARGRGVTLQRVPITDTADAVQRVVAQRRAGKTSGGAVDLVWINGENFAAGKRAGLWLRAWADDLPAMRYVDAGAPAVSRDFGVAVDGQESPWSRAAFVFAHDRRRVATPPRDFDGLLAWARAHPGRFTYPAPPDFTGSAFVRQVVAVKGEDAAFRYLRELKPLMWRRGTALPKSEAELTRLFGDAQVDFAMSYDAAFVAAGVRRGQMPPSSRPFVMGDGTLQNVSFVAIPADAAHAAGAKVIADLLLDPGLQAIKADPAVLGLPTVLEVGALPARLRERFTGARDSAYLLDDLGRPREELPADRVPELERRWKRDVLGG